jgi:GH18 family chitinase
MISLSSNEILVEIQRVTESTKRLIKQTNCLFVFVILDTNDEENSNMLRVCYITNWSRYRSGEAKFEMEFIDPFMCSHIIYAYATVDENKPEIIPIQKDDIGSERKN